MSWAVDPGADSTPLGGYPGRGNAAQRRQVYNLHSTIFSFCAHIIDRRRAVEYHFFAGQYRGLDMARNVYWVSPTGADWKVQKQGGNQAIGIFSTKADAIDRARTVAKNNMPSQVKVQRANGTIEDEWTYGDDPFPPPG